MLHALALNGIPILKIVGSYKLQNMVGKRTVHLNGHGNDVIDHLICTFKDVLSFIHAMHSSTGNAGE